MKNPLKFAKKIFETGNIDKIEEFRVQFIRKYKITVFCPEQQLEEISKAMSQAGAGKIGNYLECSFRLKGKGTFRGTKGSKPYIGQSGKLEAVDEIRLEMICDAEELNSVIAAMLEAHPYDEPAFDIYEVLQGIKQNSAFAVKLEFRKPVNTVSVFRKINGSINTSFIPESWKRAKPKFAVVDFSGRDGLPDYSKTPGHKTLYITKSLKKSINIRLV